jgi:hypothetical protein
MSAPIAAGALHKTVQQMHHSQFMFFLLLQAAVTHRLLLTPVMPPGQALQWLASKGPAPTELMMQWQVGCTTNDTCNKIT